MSEEVILAVLNEVLEELKETNKAIKEMDGNVKKLETSVEATTAGLGKLSGVVAAKPRPVLWRVSLFPENDREGNYKTFIRWLIGGIVGALLVGSAYVLANLWIQRSYPPEMAAQYTQQKKIENKSDTLDYKIINHFLDSLRSLIERDRQKRRFLNQK